MKIAVCTTFPESYFDLCAKEMLASFDAFWPQDIPLLINLDQLPKEKHDLIHDSVANLLRKKREFYISNVWEKNQVEFFNRNQTKDSSTDYRLQVCRFAHKVFALAQCENWAKQTGVDYLVWLDTDVITEKDISLDVLKKFLPDDDQVVSYLGRKDAQHSECGFVAYNLKNGGGEFIKKMVEYYETDKVLTLPGWTDCHVFDDILKTYTQKQKNLSEGIPGTHVWPLTELGKYMHHRKGPVRKLNKTDIKEGSVKKPINNGVTELNATNLDIKTKNCVNNDVIQTQVRENIFQIKDWALMCKPHTEPVVIASAGPSLNPDDLRPWADKGVKIVCVKHAIDRLNEWGIKPWACVLLDPRPHVENFVKKPNKDVIYFVASMVHPSVVKTLLDNGCTVVGYHALVGAGEMSQMRNKEWIISGGSATATRSIALLNELLGFQEFHLYGYDLCHFEKPNAEEKLADGRPKYSEVTLTTPSWGNKTIKRTFWTEGQLLAQAKELFDLYKTDQGFKMTVYGDGIGGWQYRHWVLYQRWSKNFKKGLSGAQERGFDLNEWVHAITRAS